jgi:hypothetical protein
MFASAKEVLDTVKYQPEWGNETQSPKEAILAHKLKEASHSSSRYPASGHFGGLRDDIREKGYNWDIPMDKEWGFPLGEHVSMSVGQDGPTLTNGWHRLAVMSTDRPDEVIPIETTLPRSPQKKA